MNEQTTEFIRLHADGDVRSLALKGAPAGVDVTYALQQIAGRQVARRKLPSWAAIEGLLYPPHISMEQCSSEQTAKYKEAVVREALNPQLSSVDSPLSSGDSHLFSSCSCTPSFKFVDLTGGFGVDFSFMARCFDNAIYVEQQECLCDIARHNFRLLGLNHACVVCADGVDYLQQMEPVDVIYLDPARRDSHGGRAYGIADCTPNLLEFADTLLLKAQTVVVKLSPMLDWKKAVSDLKNRVSEVHIVSVDNECKELLLVMRSDVDRLSVKCVNNDDVFSYEGIGLIGPMGPISPISSIGLISPIGGTPVYLYEPNASIMKAGCFGQIAAYYGVSQIERNSHLFVSEHLVSDFPGRKFLVGHATTMNKKELKKALSGIEKANIAVRNFPLSVAELRRRLKINEGGSTYIFATTLANKEHVLIVCQKV